MATTVTKQPTTQLARTISGESFFTPEQEQIILRSFLGNATKEEAVVLLATVARRRLDPFRKQVYFVKRYDLQKKEEVWAIQTSIDGLRAIAERTGKYDGQDEPEYGEDEAGKFCKVKVYRKDWTAGHAAVGIAYLTEFIQRKRDGTVTKFWQQMPRLMLAKCAEALALRKAFPEDTADLYIAEELIQGGEEPSVAEPQATGKGTAETLAEKLGALPPAQPQTSAPTPAPQRAAVPLKVAGGLLGMARAKLAWNLSHKVDQEKPLTPAERAALVANGELPSGDEPGPDEPPQDDADIPGFPVGGEGVSP